MTRLVHLAHYGGPYAGSWVPMLRASLAAARCRGWEAEVVFHEDARGRGWLDELEGPVRFVSTASRRRLRGEIAALLDEAAGPTILHTTFTTFDAPAAAAARRRRDTAVVWHLQSRLPAGGMPALRNAARLAVVGRWADAILCVAPDIADTARRRRAPTAKVRLFPNAIDSGRFRPATAEERGAARARAGIPPDDRVLLHYGWDWHRKGGDLFLAAVRRLSDDGARLVVREIGGGEPARELVAALGLEDVVRVEPPAADSRALYATADAFVSSSRAEGMPFATLEALASGVPVVATAIAGHEVQAAGLGAIRIAGADAAELARAVTGVLARDPATADADARTARDWVVREADLAPWAGRLMALYDELLAR